MLTFHNVLTEEEKAQICQWQYHGEYAIYNVKPNGKTGIYNPENQTNYYAFYDDDVFVGYINLIERNNKFSIGIAVKPQLCGNGYGTQMLKICCEIACSINPVKPLGLQVRSWNRRAIHCYEKTGFVISGDEYELTTPSGKGMFYRMVKV